MISKSQYLKYIPRIFFKRGLPLQFIFFVTSRCNLRCRHCFYWRQLSEELKNELTLKEIEKFVKKSKLNLLWLTLTGGEPFLRPDLPKIAELFCRNGEVINLSIPTNGQLEEEIFEATKEILKSCTKTYVLVSVSLEGPEKIHDKIRNSKGSFSKAVGTFNKLKELKTFANFGLSIQSTFTSENQSQIKGFYFFARDELKPDYYNFNLIRGDVYDKSLKKLEINYYKELYCAIKEDVNQGKWPYFNFPFNKLIMRKNFKIYEGIIKTHSQKQYLSPCYSMNLSCVLTEKGDLYPCELLANSKVGNIREINYDFSKIWYSPKSEEIRRRIKNKCFCTYECALSVNTLFNPNFYLQSFLGI